MMIDTLAVFSWLVYGFVILFLLVIWFLLISYIFKDASETILVMCIGVLWVLPVSLFLGALVFYATKYLILLGLIK